MLYDSAEEDMNTWVDITGWEEERWKPLPKYVSQFSSGAGHDYKGPEMSPEEKEEVKANPAEMDRTSNDDGKPMEGFRLLQGICPMISGDRKTYTKMNTQNYFIN